MNARNVRIHAGNARVHSIRTPCDKVTDHKHDGNHLNTVHGSPSLNMEPCAAPCSTQRLTWAAPDASVSDARNQRVRFDPYLHVFEDEGGGT
jgi:hypothetical protein